MDRRRISTRQLQIFEAVARTASYTRAAELLHLTQPAVSLQMQKLAEAVGQPLVDISGREVRLTVMGQALLSTCQALEDVWSRFEALVEEHGALARGSLRIAVVTTAKYFLPRMLGQFCRRFPGVDVELEVCNRERILQRLRQNMDDLYVMGVVPHDIDVASHRFFDNPLEVIAPADYPLPRDVFDLAHLCNERFILREAGSGTRMHIDQYLAQHGLRLNVKLSLGSNEAIREAVAGGMGLAILSRHALPPRPEEAGVRVLPVQGFPLHCDWFVVYPRSRYLGAPARMFLEELLAAVPLPRG